MVLIRYFLLPALIFSSFVAVQAQQQRGSRQDSIAQSKVIELLESRHVLRYYDENINTPGDFIYSSQVETLIKKRPGAGFDDYWIQVKDHRRYEGSGVSFNFYVDPKSWEVYYFDTEHNLVWTWEQWTQQNKYRKS